MPTYQYRCADCGNDLEAVQKFTDDPLTECPACGGGLRKRFGAVGIVFKGSGFYATDNRTRGARSAASSTSDAAKSSAATPATTTAASGSESSSGTSTPKKDAPAA